MSDQSSNKMRDDGAILTFECKAKGWAVGARCAKVETPR